MTLNPMEPPKKRKAISPKIRFEIFKRDNHTCQYCGRKAPDVALELEHIIPVIRGGTNDITNLLTACEECNAGKSANTLNDNTLIENQYNEVFKQSENIKRIKKMLHLKVLYDNNKEIEYQIFEEEFLKLYEINLDDNRKKQIKRVIRKHGLQQIFESLENLYFRDINDNNYFNIFLQQIEYDVKIKEKPHLKDLYYIRKILINKFNINKYSLKNDLYKYIEEKLLENYDKNRLINCASDCSSISHFYKLVEGNK